MRQRTVMMGAVLLVAACGGSKSKSSTSDIDSKNVSDLNASESQELCKYLSSVSGATITTMQECTEEAVDESDTKTECEQTRDACIADQSPADTNNDDCSDFEVNKKCTAKVSQVKSCYVAVLKYEDDATRSASCDHLEGSAIGSIPSSCQGLPSACIDF
ncbi:MAG: hypothetical protein JWN04_2712 [Myxococcaceae bacterium]|nr:hypothetical protein [Myxococcaceae bacterium]